MNKPIEHENYQQKKEFFDNLLNIYGRKSVLEALQSDLTIFRLHLSESNRPAPILDQILELAEAKDIEVVYHDKQALSRISKNSKQDQGIAADIICPEHHKFADWLENNSAQLSSSQEQKSLRLIALDAIHNPQNLGMIIRSAAASGIDGILIARHGTAKIGPLVIKASAGTLFKAPIIFCDSLSQALGQLTEHNTELLVLDAQAQSSAVDYLPAGHCCYILGNESEGVSDEIHQLEHTKISLPMHNEVESLNVAVSAALVCYLQHFQK